MGSYDLPYNGTVPPQMLRGTLPDSDRQTMAVRRAAALAATERIRANAWEAFGRRDVPRILNLDVNPRRSAEYENVWGPRAPAYRAPLLYVDRAKPIDARFLDHEMQARADALMDQSAAEAGLAQYQYRVNPLEEPPIHLRPQPGDRVQFVSRDRRLTSGRVPVVPGQTRVHVLGDAAKWVDATVDVAGLPRGTRVSGLDAAFVRDMADMIPRSAEDMPQAPPPPSAYRLPASDVPPAAAYLLRPYQFNYPAGR
jgi:hypothetical protein